VLSLPSKPKEDSVSPTKAQAVFGLIAKAAQITVAASARQRWRTKGCEVWDVRCGVFPLFFGISHLISQISHLSFGRQILNGLGH